MQEGLVKKEIDDAINFMFDVVSKRVEESGIAWWAQEEGSELAKKFGVPVQGGLRKVYEKVRDAIGEKLEIFNDVASARIIVELMRLGKIKGVVDDDVIAQAKLKYNRTEGHGMGPMVKSAKFRLGLVSPDGKDATTAPPTPGYIGDMTVLMGQYQKLTQEKIRLEMEIERVDAELEKYKPLARVMEAARETVKNIKATAK